MRDIEQAESDGQDGVDDTRDTEQPRGEADGNHDHGEKSARPRWTSIGLHHGQHANAGASVNLR